MLWVTYYMCLCSYNSWKEVIRVRHYFLLLRRALDLPNLLVKRTAFLIMSILSFNVKIFPIDECCQKQRQCLCYSIINLHNFGHDETRCLCRTTFQQFVRWHENVSVVLVPVSTRVDWRQGFNYTSIWPGLYRCTESERVVSRSIWR